MMPQIRQRVQDAAVLHDAASSGFDALQASIIAGRLTQKQGLGQVLATTRDLDPPDGLPDIGVAADAITDAIMSRDQVLALACDHDADGSSALSVLLEALLDYFHVSPARVMPFISHRMREGYGVTDTFVTRMLEECPEGALLITADQGSSNQAAFKRLRAERNVSSVVTDHHGIPPEGPPTAAIACVNPVRSDSKFGDPCIAGCAVAWLTMCAVRHRLIARGWLPADAPNLAGLLDFVAVGTVADASSIGRSKNNRAYIKYGLSLMNRANPRPAWAAMRGLLKKTDPFTTTDISHQIAPRVNARGRLGDAMASVQFMRSTDAVEAMKLAALLDTENQARKAIQQSMMGEAMEFGGLQAEAGRAALCVHFVNGHSGVHGIVSSRLVEEFGRPVCSLSPKQGVPGVVTGSLRSIPGVNIRQALQYVDEHEPGILLSWGGHFGAAGCSALEENIDRFHDLLCDGVMAQADPANFLPIIWTDGSLGDVPDAQTMERINALEPYGREFEAPLFQDRFTVAAARPVGDGSHLKLDLVSTSGNHAGGIWFRAIEPGAALPFGVGEEANFVYSIANNTFRGRTSIDMKIVFAEAIKH